MLLNLFFPDSGMTVDFAIPCIDLASYLDGSKVTEGCDVVAKCLHELGLLIIKDPRVSHKDNDIFIDMMVRCTVVCRWFPVDAVYRAIG